MIGCVVIRVIWKTPKRSNAVQSAPPSSSSSHSNGWRPGRSRTILYFFFFLCFVSTICCVLGMSPMFLPFHGGFLIRVSSHDHTMKMLCARTGGREKIADRKRRKNLQQQQQQLQVIKNRLTSRSVLGPARFFPLFSPSILF